MASTAKHAFPRLKKTWSKRALAGLAVAATLAMSMSGLVMTDAPAFATSDICMSNTDGYGPKIDTTGDPATVSVTADAGMVIDSYCVKAGPGYVIVPVNPPATSVIIDHPTKDSVSHYSLHQIPAPVVDVCANLPGNQTTVPAGYIENGVNCDPIPVPPVDVCANLPGNQETIPAGYVRDGDDCVLTPTPDVKQYEVGLYLYKKLNPSAAPAWENSGQQRYIASKDGTEWYTTFPGDLPVDVCGPGWSVQQDKVKYKGTFAWPSTITYPVDNIGWPPLYDAKHQDLDTLIAVPDCEIVVPKDATAEVHVTPATCDLPGKASFDITNASWDGPAVLKDGIYTRTATADAGHQFSDGTTKATVTYQLEDILNPNAPPCYTPPTVSDCVTYGSVHTTDLTTWDLSQTRATGHNELVEDGLRIWTEGATSTDKAAGYFATDFALSELGTESIDDMFDYVATFGIEPGLQMVVDFDDNGTPDGILVGEKVYGNAWWLTNGASQFVKSDAPNTGGGYGSQWYGTANEWLSEFPDARVKAVGYSGGSGVHFDGVIQSITIGCTVYTFDQEIVVLPSNPSGVIVSDCGSATVSVSNPFTPAANTVGTDATFTIEVDGVVKDTVTVAPGGAVETFKYVFDEDSGDHTVKIFSEGELISSAVVPTDCEPNVVESNPNIKVKQYCGGIDFTFSNYAELGDNEYAEAVDFHYTDANGDIQTVTVAANAPLETRSVNFNEDTGDHEVKAWIGDADPESYTVETDCEVNIIEVTPVVPKFTQPTCDTKYKLDVPKQPAGVVTDVKVTTVTFSPAEGYFFPEGTKTVYKYTAVTPAGCDSNVPPAGTGIDEAGVSLANSGLGLTGIVLLIMSFLSLAYYAKRKRATA